MRELARSLRWRGRENLVAACPRVTEIATPARIGDLGVQLFATCPPSYTADPNTYAAEITRIARWSDDAGCEGILVYTDNKIVDPWLVSQLILQATERLCPLVATQPIYMHPFAVAKMVATLGFLYGRRLYLNMVAGGYRGDLNVLHDPVAHDGRYDRLVEYTHLVRALLSGDPVTFAGRYYQVTNARLAPALRQDLLPGVFVSGSSDAGLAAARALEATAVQYPEPAQKAAARLPRGVASCGIRVGIIAREDPAAAWRIAHERFPEDRRGRLTHELAMKLSDSTWHRQLSALTHPQSHDDDPYWMVPFQHYKTFCPYLVGGYDRVAAELARYLRIGFRTVILDVPASSADLDHTNEVVRRAAAIAAA